MRVVKRYSNRKLYDTERSRYVTLEELATMIRDGVELCIIDNTTKEDLTAVTMAQIRLGEEKRQPREQRRPELSQIRDFIQQRGESISRRITEPVHNLKNSVEESVTRLLRSGEDAKEQIQGWIDHNTSMVEELQRRVDDRVRLALAALDPLARLQQQITELKARVERLEAERDRTN